MLFDARDLALDPPYSLGFADATQVRGVQSGIEVVGVVDLDGFGERKPAGFRGFALEAVVTEFAAEPRLLRRQPVVLEIAHPGGAADGPEGVHVAITEPAPVFKGDSQLE